MWLIDLFIFPTLTVRWNCITLYAEWFVYAECAKEIMKQFFLHYAPRPLHLKWLFSGFPSQMELIAIFTWVKIMISHSLHWVFIHCYFTDEMPTLVLGINLLIYIWAEWEFWKWFESSSQLLNPIQRFSRNENNAAV